MKFERKHAVLLIAVAVWNVVTFGNFAKNLVEAAQEGEDRPAGYFIAHTVLIVVNVAIAVVLGRLGWQAWKATKESPVERSLTR